MSKSAAKTVQDINSNLEAAYDELPYEAYVYPQTHPDRLFNVATIFKLNPPTPEKSRILEIGCGTGGNLIPLAMLHPETQSLGVDLSGAQIEMANDAVREMGLTNIEFRQMDISKFPEDAGLFDYIICHGVFSWVPDFVRDSILEVCRRHLSPDGLAVISYNVLPGWGMVKTLRDMMMFHVRNFTDPAIKVKEARQLLNFLYQNVHSSNTVYRDMLQKEIDILSKTNDTYIFHEHLESQNHQYYLHEFVALAAAHDLTYVGDTEVSTMYVGNFNQTVQNTLNQITDIVHQEQYMDFLYNRRFRHSILTHAANIPKISRNIDKIIALNYYVQAKFKPAPEQPEDKSRFKFVIIGADSNFETADQPTIAGFKTLCAQTRPVKLETIARDAAAGNPGLSYDDILGALITNTLPLVMQGFINLHYEPYTFVTELSPKPRAFVWARKMAKIKNAKSGITNLRRENIVLNPFQRALVTYLDGTNDFPALLELMVQEVVSDNLKMHIEDRKLTDPVEIRAILDNQIKSWMPYLAAQGLLEA